MQFKNKFWSDQIETADYFGHIPDSSEDRGFGCLFYDVSGKVCVVNTDTDQTTFVIPSFADLLEASNQLILEYDKGHMLNVLPIIAMR